MVKLEAFLASMAGKLVLAGLVLALAAWGYHQWQRAANSRSEARVSEFHDTAAQDSGHDAVNAVGALNGRDTAADDLTRSNADAIRSAPGAAAPVDPAVRAVGLRSLCQRRAYHCAPDCLQFTPAGCVEGASTGSAAAKR